MTIRVRIDHDNQSLDRTFGTADEAAHFLELVAYYVTRESVGAIARRFRRKVNSLGSVLEGAGIEKQV